MLPLINNHVLNQKICCLITQMQFRWHLIAVVFIPESAWSAANKVSKSCSTCWWICV